MFSSLKIRNFQSLKSVDIDLGRFTVIVGPSSSGKSALVRACRLLVSNSRGTSYVTRGQKVAGVSVLTDTGAVALERGEGVGRYVITAGAGGPNQGAQGVYTKIGTTVPPAVSQFLDIPADTQVNFAGQFDRPFLLDSSGSEVARALGSLTGVSLIFSASREANRRRLAVGAELKTRESDLASLLEGVQRFKDLAARTKAVGEAELALGLVEFYQTQTSRLRDLVVGLEVAEAVLARAVEPVEPIPDLEEVERTTVAITTFHSLLAYNTAQSGRFNELAEELAKAAVWEERLEQELQTTLRLMEVCPTCGQSTKEVVTA